MQQSNWYEQQLLLEEMNEETPIPPPFPHVENRNREKKCYTCSPKGMVQRHIISDTRCTTFHFDMWKRPFLLVTPKHHYREIHEMEPDIMAEFFRDIHTFSLSWGFQTYQIMMNVGDRNKPHDHFHVKVRVDTQRLQQMRDDHFTRQTYQRALRTPR